MPSREMSAVRSAKSSAGTKSRGKSVLATLERLSGSSNPDKDQTRYLCNKLLQLVNDQESSRKDVTSKAGLDIVLLTLENCNDQATCMALVSTLSEVANGGHSAIKKLIVHDATRVLLHTLAYLGSRLDWRLLSAIIRLLSKIGPKDRRFTLRARLTGSLSMILTSVRSSHNHTSRAKLLPASLAVLKLSVFNSSSNATLLGRAGAVNVLQRIVTSLTRKYPALLKTALATLNLLVRLSKANASRAVNMGLMSQLLTMHQEYHKNDFRYSRHSAIRKSILNTIKNIATLKSGRKAFMDSNGLLILYNSSKDYLAVGYTNKAVDSLLLVAIMIIRRCQPKEKLPVSNSRCTFQFDLPGARQRLNSMDSVDLEESDDDFDENLETLSDEEVDGKDENTEAKRKGSTISTSKGSAGSNGSRDTAKSKVVTRSNEDLKIYETFFSELQEFPFVQQEWDTRINEPRLNREARQNSLAKGSYERHSLPELNRFQLSQPCVQRRESCNPWEIQCDVANASNNFQSLMIDTTKKGTPGTSMATRSWKPNLSKSYSSGDALKAAMHSNLTVAWPQKRYNKDFASMSKKGFALPNISNSLSNSLLASNLDGRLNTSDTNLVLNPDHQEVVEFVQRLAQQTKSMKERTNRLSEADACGSLPVEKVEPQVNKKTVQSLIKSKILQDVARFLFPKQLINKVVFTSETSNSENLSCSNENDIQGPSEDISCDVALEKSPAFVQQVDELNTDASDQVNSCNTQRPIENINIVIPSFSDDAEVANSVLLDADLPASVSDRAWVSTPVENVPCEAVNSNLKTADESNILELLTSDVAATIDLPQVDVSPPLVFGSNFESGNLRVAMRVREYEYDLVLNPDCNSNHHFQWFYFSVSQMEASQPYRFNIINCEKKGSVVNEGMQPVMYSMHEARSGRPCWCRAGSETCYYRNHFLRSHLSASVKSRTYFTFTFTITFKQANDTCYFAYHYPYSYTKLQLDLQHFTRAVDPNTMYVRNQTLCHTLAGNAVPALTITARPRSDDFLSFQQGLEEMRSRPYIFLTARVHPGESNASWTMRGTLRLLLTPPPSECDQDEGTMTLAAIAEELRRSYIFKIVPMLNPDGVINGHHRCSLSGEDLNRTWLDPNPEIFPTIYHTKGLLQYLNSIQKAPLVYCDYHGHSRKMNVFLYGCSHRESISAGEAASVKDGPDDSGYKVLPRLLSHLATIFSLKDCSFVVEKPKTSTARVVVWKEVGVARSYTMESTYCGCDQGALRGKQIGTRELEAMGSKFCEVLLHIKEKNKTRGLPVYDVDEEITGQPEVASQTCKDERGADTSPRCPVNSDAELTPDDDISFIDAEAFDVAPASVHDESSFMYKYVIDRPRHLRASESDMAFWRYDPDNPPYPSQPRPSTVNPTPHFSFQRGSDLSSCDNSGEPAAKFSYESLSKCPPSHASTGCDSLMTTSKPSSRLESRKAEEIAKTSPRAARYKPLPVIAAKVSPVTGRILNYVYKNDDEVTTAPRPFESGLVLKKISPQSRDKEGLGEEVLNGFSLDLKTARGRRRSLKHSS